MYIREENFANNLLELQLRALYLLRGRKDLRFRVVIQYTCTYIYLTTRTRDQTRLIPRVYMRIYIYIQSETSGGWLYIPCIYIILYIIYLHIHMASVLQWNLRRKPFSLPHTFHIYIHTRTCKAQTIRTNCPHFFFLSEKTGVITHHYLFHI